MIESKLPTDPIERVEIEAVFSKGTQVIAWRDLQDERVAARLGLYELRESIPAQFFQPRCVFEKLAALTALNLSRYHFHTGFESTGAFYAIDVYGHMPMPKCRYSQSDR